MSRNRGATIIEEQSHPDDAEPADVAVEPATAVALERIIEQHEAGIADLMAAYEPAEKRYFDALAGGMPPATYSTNTNFSG